MKLLNRFLPGSHPRLDWIQVGVTSKCNARCIYCPHWSMKDKWEGLDLPIETFRKLTPSLSRTELVYLQGWGEPLMHPDFFEMLRLVKKNRARAGLTSNATLLDREKIRKLAGEGLDIVSLSIAGVDQANDRIRKGTTLKKVLSAIEEIHRVKAFMGGAGPQIHLAYMLLRSGLKDLDSIPGFLNSLGVDQIVVSGLTLALNSEMEKEMHLADSKEEFRRVKDSLLEMKNRLDEPDKLFFHVYNPFIQGRECSENIHKACYMSAQGLIRPCVYTDFPDSGSHAFRYFNGRQYPLLNLDFGNISSKPLKKIWTDSDYQQFRDDFSRNRFLEQCLYCTKRFIDGLTDPV